jgi:hypothetical protein
MELTLKVAKVIVEELYGGSMNAWRKRGRKCNSLRALAIRTDLPMSATAIYRSVAIYELVTRAGGIGSFSRLTIGHFRAVLSVCPTEQLTYLRAANDEEWTASQLEEKARHDGRENERRRGGRRPTHPVFRAVRTATRALDGAVQERSSLGHLVDGSVREAMRAEIATLLVHVMDLARRMDVFVPSNATHAPSEGDA